MGTQTLRSHSRLAKARNTTCAPDTLVNILCTAPVFKDLSMQESHMTYLGGRNSSPPHLELNRIIAMDKAALLAGMYCTE